MVISQSCDKARSRYQQWGKVLSHLTNPLVLGPPAMAVIACKEGDVERLGAIPFLLALLVMSIIPLLYVVIMVRLGLFVDFFVTDRSQRVYFIPVIIVCFMLGGLMLRWFGASALIWISFLSAAVTMILVFIINQWWKISLHTTGVTTICIIYLYSLGALGTLFIIMLPITIWARLVLREHTFMQLLGGMVLGGLATHMQFCLYFH